MATSVPDLEGQVLRPRARPRRARRGSPTRRIGALCSGGDDHAAARRDACDRSSAPHAGRRATRRAPRRITTTPFS